MTTTNRVAVVTGAARGQGRSHAVALAAEGMDVIAIDCCADIVSIPYPLATVEDLAQTADLVRQTGRRVHTVIADVRDFAAIRDGIDSGITELGEIDVVIANAGVVGTGLTDPFDGDVFSDILVRHPRELRAPHRGCHTDDLQRSHGASFRG
jgi:NAD(P)-dependent dehydrogenase (short-subunit alcohol dehydrogenase family)